MAQPVEAGRRFPCWDPEGLWDFQVPGTWKAQFTETRWYDGHAVFLRDFALDAVDAGAEAWLVFDGVVYAIEVYLNGHEAPFWRPMHSDEWYRQFAILSANLYVDLGEADVVYRRFVELLGRYGKPLLISEFGSMSLRASEVPADRLGSEVRHARLLAEAYAAFAALPQVVGTSHWCLADGRAPIHWRWYNQGKALYRYGMYDEEFRPNEPVQAALKAGIAALRALPG